MGDKLALQRVHTGDYVSDQAQRLAQQVAQRVNDLGDSLAGGVQVFNVTISTAGTSVPHTLGRSPEGYMVTRVRGVSTSAVYTVLDNGSHTSTALALKATCSVGGTQTLTADLWVY